ncbi:Uncharacterized protein APZ42_029635 [Daphnia magna]|uniref:MULE transposase domain-containing protein n=1 Tax=Daphnia magna TaxID=35525 RepID=A0A164PFP5_9CRUS|nr:Uncharacterized protein APZ42_029635 [Daphnia magna]
MYDSSRKVLVLVITASTVASLGIDNHVCCCPQHLVKINCGETPESFTTQYNNTVLHHKEYPNEVLVNYEGNASCFNKEYSHGYAKRPEKTEKPLYRTTQSVLTTAKERKDDPPSQVYGDIIEGVGKNMKKKQAVQAPRNLQQVKNAQKAARRATTLSHDAQYSAYLSGIETNFMRKFELYPEFNYACLHFEMADEFQLLLDRTDSPAVVMEYDTNIDLVSFNVSWLSFHHTEYEDLPGNPIPTIGLACFLHSKKLQSSYEYFFNRIKEEIKRLAEAKNIIICTDEEQAIVNTIEKLRISGIKLITIFLGNGIVNEVKLLFDITDPFYSNTIYQDQDQLHTIPVEIEATVNSRPLTYVFGDD